MARHQQVGDGDAGDTATIVVGGENRPAKEMLIYANTHEAFALESFRRQFSFVDIGDVFQLSVLPLG